jgi:hypothetical protein
LFGTPLGEWIEAIPNELETDAVGLWGITPDLRQSGHARLSALQFGTAPGKTATAKNRPQSSTR